MSHVKFCGIALSFISCLSVYADPATWYVDDDNYGKGGTGSAADPFGTIQEAVDAASAGDTVSVAEGTYDEGTTNAWSYSHGGNWIQQTRVLVTKKLTIIASGEKSKTVILGSEGTPEHSTSGTSRWYRTDSISCMVIGSGVTGVRVEGFTFEHGFAHQSAGGNSLAAGGLACYTTNESATFQDAFTAVNCDFVDCYGRGAGGIRGGTAIRCLFRGCMASYRATSAYGSRLFNCISRSGRSDAGAKPDFVNCLVVNCTIMNNFGKFGLAMTTDATAKPEGFGTAYNTVSYGNYIRYQDSTPSPGYAHDVVCDLNRDPSKAGSVFAEGSTDVTYLDTAVQADMTSACVCPATLDFRPVEGGCLDGKGNSDLIKDFAFIPEEELKRDFNGDAFDGALPIGAILPSAEVASGVVKMGANFSIDGNDTATYPAYLQSETWPRSVRVANRTVSPTTGLVGLTYNGHRHYFGKYDCVHLPLPAKVDEKGAPYSLEVSGYACSQTLYVGGEGASDETGDGSEGKPYATIQKAVDDSRVLEKGVHTLISVRPGTYGGEGRADPNYGDFKAAVVVPKSTYVFIRAESDDRGATVLKGAPDPDTKGIGDGAVRCASAQSSATFCICGFTLSGGYAGATKETSAGAVRGSGQNQQAVDCVFTGNHGDAACGNNVWFRRCLFTNNTAVAASGGASGVLINSNASGCIFAGNHLGNGAGYLPIGSSSHAYHCTIYEPEGGVDNNVYNGDSRLVNTVIAAGGVAPARNKGRVAGCVINAVKDTNADPDTLHGDAGLSDPAHGDFRPFTVSPALGAGVGSDPLNVVTTLQFVEMDTCGYFNEPIVAADGTITSGAVMETCEPRSVFVSPSGNDDNDGSTEASAKQTINAGIAALRLGLELTVLPGVYKVGKLPHEGAAVVGAATPALKNRVVVPAGYTLKSRDGAETTIIEGEPDPDAEGCGPNAIRCVFLETGAKICGFTLRGGYTCDNSIGNMEDTYGAAVLGRGYASGTRVVDCIIAGNTGCRGGGGGYTIFDRCIVTNNTATAFGSAGIFCSAFNSYFAESYGPRVLDYPTEVVNCTFGEGCLNAKGGAATYQIFSMADVVTADSKVVNVLIAGATTTAAVDLSKIPVRNFVVPAGMGYIYGEDASGLVTNLTLAAIMSGYDADRHPISADAVGVDIGFKAEAAGDVDLAGNMRVVNGAIDVGCYEYDWKGEYAKSLGRRVTVTEASGTLKMTDGHPLMRDGDALAATVAARPSATEGDYVVRAALTGNGKMLVYLNGALLGELTATDELRFTSDRATNDLRFEYEGEGSAYVAKVAQELGGLLIIR